jgi:hypothetical protein
VISPLQIVVGNIMHRNKRDLQDLLEIKER